MAGASVRGKQVTQPPYEARDQRRGTGLAALLTGGDRPGEPAGAEGDDGAR